MALGALDLAKYVAAPDRDGGRVGPSGDAGHEDALGVREPAAEPVGYAQVEPGDVVQKPLALAELGQRPRCERGRGLGVPAEPGEKAAVDGDQRRDVHQQAASPASRRLERLLGRAGMCPLGRLDQALHRLHAASGRGQLGLRQQQSGTRPDQVSGERGKPPLNRHPLAAQTGDRIELPLDQLGRPCHLPGGHRVPDRILGQSVLFMPGGGVTVQLRHLGGLSLQQAGAEQVGEQVVEAPPAAHLIQRHQEQPGPLHLLQQLLAPAASGDRVG